MANGDRWEREIAKNLELDAEALVGIARTDRTSGGDMAAAFFYLFSVLAVASAAAVVLAKNPVHAVLFLILTFFNAAGLFVLLGAEFLAMLLVVVYVGAVAVLFLFVVMMLDVDFAELRAGFIKNAPVGALVGGIVLAELVALFAVHGLVNRARKNRRCGDASRLDEHRGAGPAHLHEVRLFLPGGRHDPAGGHDRRDRADAQASRRREAPVDRRAGCARAPKTALEVIKVPSGGSVIPPAKSKEAADA